MGHQIPKRTEPESWDEPRDETMVKCQAAKANGVVRAVYAFDDLELVVLRQHVGASPHHTPATPVICGTPLDLPQSVASAE
jgi:hypothetical protein